MIFVALGTQDKKFKRLLQILEDYSNESDTSEKIIVQAGCTDFKSKKMEIHNLLSMEEYDSYIKKCDILVTHGGVGTILEGVRNNKKIIALARVKKYKEHTNDHQIQIVEAFSNQGYLLNLDNYSSFNECLNSLKNFKPKKFELNKNKFSNEVGILIDKLLK